jgi:hypothetical protein
MGQAHLVELGPKAELDLQLFTDSQVIESYTTKLEHGSMSFKVDFENLVSQTEYQFKYKLKFTNVSPGT